MVHIVGGVLTSLFLSLSFAVCNSLWSFIGWHVYPQAVLILIIAALGEHYVSGKGYYSYTSQNGYFIGRVPLWIPFMWVFMVQSTLLLTLMAGLTSLHAVYFSGIICVFCDLVVIEPLLCSQRGFWEWTVVERGYFRFIPAGLNRFTAPPGNYIVWFLFPFLLNSALYITSLLV